MSGYKHSNVSLEKEKEGSLALLNELIDVSGVLFGIAEEILSLTWRGLGISFRREAKMSGYKYSNVNLGREKEEKLGLVSDVRGAGGILSHLITRTREILNQTPDGLRTTFESEVEEALEWLREAELQRFEDLGMESTSSDLRAALSQLKQLAQKGQTIMNNLVSSFTERADAMERELASRLSHLEGIFFGYSELFKTWLEQKKPAEFEELLGKARGLLQEQRFQKLNELLEKAEKLLNSMVSEAKEMEHKHQKRLYVLKALRQVCKEMGFEELELYYEKEGKMNPIIYEVDTLDQGKIRFCLSLEAINTFSEIPGSHCLDEFDKLSQYLRDEFGVKTKFRIEDEKPDERLIRKGEMDLPEGTHMEKSL